MALDIHITEYCIITSKELKVMDKVIEILKENNIYAYVRETGYEWCSTKDYVLIIYTDKDYEEAKVEHESCIKKERRKRIFKKSIIIFALVLVFTAISYFLCKY